MTGARPDQLEIQWKPGRIVIIVKDAVLGATADDDEDEDVNDDNETDIFDEYDDEEEDEDEDDDDEELESEGVDDGDVIQEDDEWLINDDSIAGRIDLAALARAVNDALDDDGVGASIAETHEIEVTTPGASDELTTLSSRQLNSYKGFDVTVIHSDPKSKTNKTIQGRLVSRDQGITTINIKGRMKKLQDSDVQSMKLPKAKRE